MFELNFEGIRKIKNFRKILKKLFNFVHQPYVLASGACLSNKFRDSDQIPGFGSNSGIRTIKDYENDLQDYKNEPPRLQKRAPKIIKTTIQDYKNEPPKL